MPEFLTLGLGVGKASVEISEEGQIKITFSFKRIPRVETLTISKRPTNLLTAVQDAQRNGGQYVKFKEDNFEGEVSFHFKEVYLTVRIQSPHLYCPIIDSEEGIQTLVGLLKKLPL